MSYKPLQKEVLDTFGRTLVHEVYDSQMGYIKQDLTLLRKGSDYNELFEALDEKTKKELELYSQELLRGALFDFLRIFEENTRFQLVSKKSLGKSNLVDISENLKAEPIIEGGWIDRFSKFSKMNREE